MTMIFRTQPVVPRDHIGFLIARHGWWRVALGFAIASALRPMPRAPKSRSGEVPISDHLRRDIGMPPLHPAPMGIMWR